MNKFNLTTTQSTLIDKFSRWGSIFIVGGACRDLFLGRTPKDIDFATNLLPDKVIELVDGLGFVRIPDATAYHHGIIRIVDKETGEIIDIATTRSDTRCDGRHCTPIFTNDIKEDLARRDFTINSIAIKTDQYGNILNIIDPFGGRQDIKRKVVRFVGDCEDRIEEDYLRIIRWCRMQALHPDMKHISYQRHIILNNRFGIDEISKERIKDEIVKSLSYPAPGNFWRCMHDCGMFDVIFPELRDTIDCKQNKYHNDEPVWDHLIRTFEAIVELTDNPMLRLAALLHDVGKPTVKSVGEDGGIHFFKHEIESAGISYKWMKKYKFSNEECEYVSNICKHHQFQFEENVKRRTIRRWLQKVGKNTWEDLFTLRCADRRGNITKEHLPMITKQMWEFYNKAKEIVDTKQPLFREDLAINGNDIKALGIKPGPKYKEMFGNLLGLVIADPTKNNKETLTEWILNHKKEFEG